MAPYACSVTCPASSRAAYPGAVGCLCVRLPQPILLRSGRLPTSGDYGRHSSRWTKGRTLRAHALHKRPSQRVPTVRRIRPALCIRAYEEGVHSRPSHRSQTPPVADLLCAQPALPSGGFGPLDAYARVRRGHSQPSLPTQRPVSPSTRRRGCERAEVPRIVLWVGAADLRAVSR